MWATQGSVPRLIMTGFVCSILSALTALGLIMGLYAVGIQVFYSEAVLAVSFVSHIIGMVTTAGMTYAEYLDDAESFAAVERSKA